MIRFSILLLCHRTGYFFAWIIYLVTRSVSVLLRPSLLYAGSELYRPISVSLDLKATAAIDQAFEPEVLWLMVTVRWNCKIMKAATGWQDWFVYGGGRGMGQSVCGIKVSGGKDRGHRSSRGRFTCLLSKLFHTIFRILNFSFLFFHFVFKYKLQVCYYTIHY